MKKSLAILVPVALCAALVLTGCDAVDDLVSNESSRSYDTTADLDAEWDKTAPWVPVDASDIRIREARDGDPAVLGARTESPLSAEECAEVERQSAPAYAPDWAPDPYIADAWACGAWTVIATDDGWFGWTPNDPDEAASSPR